MIITKDLLNRHRRLHPVLLAGVIMILFLTGVVPVQVIAEDASTVFYVT